MTALTPEQREYKERTAEYLRVRLPELAAQLAQETRPDAATSLRHQLEDIQIHVELLERELASNTVIEPVADELCKQVAGAIVKQKFYMARRYITRLETIEPYYPDLERLRQDAETGQVSRRTRSITQGNLATSRSIALPPRPAALLAAADGAMASPPLVVAPAPAPYEEAEEPGPGGLRQFFQVHYLLSCMVVLLVLCLMAGVGGVSLLEWLLKGL